MSNDKVKLYEEIITINEHNQLPLNPHPPYGNVTGYICYPNQFYGSKQFQIEQREIKLLIAENEYLKIAMAPNYGGRLWYIYDKLKQCEVLHKVNTDAKIYNAGMGFNYMGGGLELNLPNAHSQTNMRPRVGYAKENEDGSVSLIMQNIEKIGRVQWTVSFTLHPGEARVEHTVRIANETPVEARYLYWSNCGVPADGDSEFIYPEKAGSLHGDYENSVSWPYYDQTNIALMKNLDEMLGLYMLNAQEGYFGAYNHKTQTGLLHYADVNDLPGKKTWTWGWHEDAQHTKHTHSDTGDCYLEIQGGRITIQEELERIMPMSSAEWTEYWYPYSDIGIVNGVSATAAINFSITATENNQASAEIKLFANRNLENLELVLCRGNEKLKTVALAALKVGQPETLTVALDCAIDECDTIAAVIVDANNAVIVNALPEVVRKQDTDSYFKPRILVENQAEDFTAEGYFSKAEVLLKDWFEHLPEIKRLLNESLKVDPGFSRAHVELGMICLKGGQYETALTHFDKVLERIVDDGRTIYYRGLTLWLLGRASEAKATLRRSGRFGYECQERVLEAIIAINQADNQEAYRQLAQAERVGGNVLLTKVLKAIMLHRDGDNAAALKALAEAENITPDNSFIYCTRYLLSDNDSELKQQITAIYSGLQSEILEVIAIFNFAGLNSEAYALLELIDASNEMVELYRNHLSQLLGIAATAIPAVGGVQDFAWRMEECLILQQAIKLNPEQADNYFHLGNFYYGHGFYEAGITAWETATAKGLVRSELIYQLFKAYQLQGNTVKANQAISDAFALDCNDPYIFDDYVEMVFNEQGTEAGIKFMEDNLTTVVKYFPSTHKLLSSYMSVERFDDMEQLLKNINFGEFSRNPLGRHWVILKQGKGFIALQNGDYKAALDYFTESTEVPANISLHYLPTLTLRARKTFYQGLCCAKLGDNKLATKYWEETLTLKLRLRFEYSAKFTMCCTKLFHAFALKGMKRYADADLCREVITESGYNPKFPATAQQSLLKIASMVEQYEVDDFDKFDTPAGFVSNMSMATSVED